MRTLALLATLLFLTLQAQAGTLPETADQVSAQKQLWAEDQDQAGDNDQVVAMSFTGEERLTQAGGPGTYCYCTLRKYCNFPEKAYRSCKVHRRRGKLCCR